MWQYKPGTGVSTVSGSGKTLGKNICFWKPSQVGAARSVRRVPALLSGTFDDRCIREGSYKVRNKECSKV